MLAHNTHVGDDHPRLSASLVGLGNLRDRALLAARKVDGRVDPASLVVRRTNEGIFAVARAAKS